MKFQTVQSYEASQEKLYENIRHSDGKDVVVIYISGTKQIKRLPINMTVEANGQLVDSLSDFLGKDNVKLVEKSIENTRKKV